MRDHGDLVSRETARIVEAMQGYVQGGTEAMGHLAQRVEQHAESFATQDIQIADDVRAAVAAGTEPIQQQLELVSERVGLHGRAQDEVRVRLEALIDARIRGLAELVRSDSNALRALIEERAAAVVTSTDGPIVQPVVDSDAIAEAAGQQVAIRLTSAELRLEGQLEKMMDSQLVRIGEQLEARLADHLEARFGSMAEIVAQRAAEAADVAIASSFGSGLQTQASIEDRLMTHIDDRMTGIARLIRSDNQALADRLTQAADAMPAEPVPSAPSAEPELVRETLRTLKEFQAGLPGEVAGSMDTRFRAVTDQLHAETQSTAEAMIKVAEVLGREDRPADGPRGRGVRQRPAGGHRPHVRRDPRDVGRRPPPTPDGVATEVGRERAGLRPLRLRQPNDRFAALDGPFGDAAALAAHPRVDGGGPRGRIHRANAATRHQLLTHEHRRAELGGYRHDGVGRAGPVAHTGRQVPHREHPVRDDPVETDAARERVVLVQRVLVAARVGVGPHVLAGDHPPALRQLLARRHRRERAHAHAPSPRSISEERPVHTGSPFTSVISVTSIRKRSPPFCFTDSTRRVAVSVSPSRIGRWCS